MGVSCFVLLGKLVPHIRVLSNQSPPPLRFYFHRQERFEPPDHDGRILFLPDIPINEREKSALMNASVIMYLSWSWLICSNYSSRYHFSFTGRKRRNQREGCHFDSDPCSTPSVGWVFWFSNLLRLALFLLPELHIWFDLISCDCDWFLDNNWLWHSLKYSDYCKVTRQFTFLFKMGRILMARKVPCCHPAKLNYIS